MKKFSSFLSSYLPSTKATTMTSPKSTTGTIPFKVPGLDKECCTWYKVFGDLKSGVRPLIALHGGPGVGYVQLSIRCLFIIPMSHFYSLLIFLNSDLINQEELGIISTPENNQGSLEF